ncbi:COP9 signalosome complex subunit 8, partial [Lamellibrachia satsuma]
SPGGIATPQLYGQLLAIYLLQNDLPSAKFLWKRIPQTIKTENGELLQIWTLGQKMWQRDLPGTYEALHKDWSDNVKSIMAAIQEATRNRVFSLVARAYSYIRAEELASFLGMSVNEAVLAAVSHEWTADSNTGMITPKIQETPPEPPIPSEQQLARLTDFVAFLEN